MQRVYECRMNNVDELKQRLINCCRMTNFELLRWLVEAPSRDIRHYHLSQWHTERVDGSTFLNDEPLKATACMRSDGQLFEHLLWAFQETEKVMDTNYN